MRIKNVPGRVLEMADGLLLRVRVIRSAEHAALHLSKHYTSKDFERPPALGGKFG